jgi:hypothetical protein
MGLQGMGGSNSSHLSRITKATGLRTDFWRGEKKKNGHTEKLTGKGNSSGEMTETRIRQ